MRALVFGGAGFIGSRIVRSLLASGSDVVVATRRDREAGHNKAPIDGAETLVLTESWPVTLPATLRDLGITHAVDAAWLGATPNLMEAAANTQAASAMLQRRGACAKAGLKYWLGLGSCAEYSWSAPMPLNESSERSPSSLYGAAKTEVYNTIFCAGLDHTLTSGWMRPFFVYGPGDHPHRLLPSIAHTINKGERPHLRQPENFLDFVHVDDVAAAATDLCEARYQGAMNLSTGQGVSVKQMADWIWEAAGAPENLRPAASSGAPPPLNVEGDPSLLEEVLGWRPRAASSELVHTFTRLL